MVTLKELAERTGYAPATISRILNGDPTLSVTDQARKRVLEEAGRLNYPATRSRRGRTRKSALRLGLAEMLSPVQQLEDPYYLYLSSYVRQGCMEKKYTCVPLERQDDRFLPPADTALDGIVAIGLFTEAQISNLQSICSNLVFLDSAPFEGHFDSVVLNYELGIRLALEHLKALHHRRIAFVGPSQKLDDLCQPAVEVRSHLFRTLQAQDGLLQPELLLDCPMDPNAAAACVSNFLSSAAQPATAFLCANEEIAVGTLRALHAANLAVPEAASVVSFNNTPRASLLNPPLTSISAHVEEMAKAALTLVAERVGTAEHPPCRTLPLKVVVPPTLVPRQSSSVAPDWQETLF